MLSFEEQEHVYQWDGKVVPSVTQILTPINNLDGIPPHILEHARERGVAVHKACELFDFGQLDESTLDPVLVPYLEAWKMFLHTWGAEVELAEHRMFHQGKSYAGTVDRIIRAKKKARRFERRYLADIKATFAHVESVGPQTAGYLDMWNHEYPDETISNRLSIRLKNDGKFEAVPLKDRSDLRTFQSCHAVWKWRNSHYQKGN
jgi:hypothetical protein